MGKTSLLSRFKHQCPSEVKYVPFDCKGVTSVAAFLSQVVVDLGHDQFETFTGKVRGFVQGGVDFSDNDIAAEKTISIAINSIADAATHDYRLAQLQDAFFTDLAALDYRTIVTLDTYQLAIEPFQQWIENQWLRAVERQLGNVVAIVAGQSIPDPYNSVWGDECEHFSLEPIVELTEWCRFCSDLSEDTVRTAMLIYEGHPAKVHQTLTMLRKK